MATGMLAYKEWTPWHNDSYNAGTTPTIDLPAIWSELNVVVSLTTIYNTYSFLVVKKLCVNEMIFRQGFYAASSDWGRVHFQYLNTNKIKIIDAQTGGGNQPFTVKIAYK